MKTQRITSRAIKLPKGVTNINAYQVLEIILREALQNTPEDLAVEMKDAYLAGRGLQLLVRQSKYGEDRQTALSWKAVDIVEPSPGKWKIKPALVETRILTVQPEGTA
jgi:hypothetical protein